MTISVTQQDFDVDRLNGRQPNYRAMDLAVRRHLKAKLFFYVRCLRQDPVVYSLSRHAPIVLSIPYDTWIDFYRKTKPFTFEVEFND